MNFRDSFLHGPFKRYDNRDQICLEGYYYHGLQDSLWTYYGHNEQVHTQKYFEKGELVKEDEIENNQVVASQDYFSRSQKITQKKFVLALLLALAIGLFYFMHKYRKRLDSNLLLKPLGGCVAIFFIPVLPLLIAHLIYRMIPYRHEPAFQPLGFGPFNLFEMWLGYMVVGILYIILVTSEKKFKANLWVLLSLSVIIGIMLVFLNELMFLLRLIENYQEYS